MKIQLIKVILLFFSLFLVSIVHGQSLKLPKDLIQELNIKDKAIGRDYRYTNIPGTHIYMRLVSSNTYGYTGLLNHWSNGAECLISEYYNVDIEKTIEHFQSIGSNTIRYDTVLNSKIATILIGERKNGIIAHTLILSDQNRVAAILLQYPKSIPENEIDIFETMLYSSELYPEASIDIASVMALAPFTIDWKTANDLTKLKNEIDLMDLTMDKTPPQPLVFYGMNEGFYEFTNGGIDPGNAKTSRVRIQHTLKSDFKGDAEAYLRQCLENYGLNTKTSMHKPIEEQMINGEKALILSFSFRFEEDDMESNYMLYVYEDKEKFMNLIIGIKPSNNPFWLLYTTGQARNFAESIKIRTLENNSCFCKLTNNYFSK